MQKTRKILIFIALIIILIGLLPLAIPDSLYRNKLVDGLQKRLHGPVQIGHSGIEYAPAPTLVMHDVVVSDPATASIARISVPLSLHNLLHWGREIRGVTLEGGEFSPRFAMQLPEKLRPEADQPRLTQIELKRSTVRVGSGKVGPVDGTLRFAADGQLAELQAGDEAGHLDFHVQPKGQQFAVTLTASGYALPFGYPVQFDRLLMKGLANADGIDIEDIRGDLYGGIVTGRAQLDWRDGWKLAGTLRTNGIQAEPFSKVFSEVTHVSGRLTGEANFAYQADDYRKIFDTAGIDAQFNVTDGMLHNFDLVTPLKSTQPATYARGGQTRFETFTGRLVVRGDTVRIADARLAGGKFSASGQLGILPGRKLDGAIVARLSGGTINVANRITAGGVLKSPELSTASANRPQPQPVNLSTDTPDPEAP
ncbi:AsmA-like C-terminal region-containing protein [Jeongeupia sp. USM3]|uniref:AsmA-like C-terminal region-containing protein n=1 Tax=Jeongeupia sp. USM3 TaxID=1906741 RepID=UPI00089DEA78|nr:AsmA-like C-terminal region-containing protein [Jeongeupia sp. USM3]AOY00317.1 hypothetical protein BJP62_07580 [Jeongeupia sp. USM3]